MAKKKTTTKKKPTVKRKQFEYRPDYDPSKAPFDWEKLEAIMNFRPKKKHAAEILGISHETLKVHIKQRYDESWEDYSERKIAKTALKLTQKMLEVAFSGNVAALIFCQKNINKWKDNPDIDYEAIPTLTLKYPQLK